MIYEASKSSYSGIYKEINKAILILAIDLINLRTCLIRPESLKPE